MEVRGRSRKNKGRAAIRRRIKAWMSMVLTAAMIMGNMAASVNTVLASPSVTKEEFRLRAAAIQKAAEKALDEGEAITEEILLDGKDKSVLKEYQEMFKADGRLYELDILKDLETVKDVSGVTLRVFMRLPKDADPKTHVLTGEEELYFLYVNDGDESVTARLNIEGLISGFSTVRPYEAVFGEKEKILENQEAIEENGAAETEEPTEGEENTEAGETEESAERKPAGGNGSGSGSGASGSGSSSGNGNGSGSDESSAANQTEGTESTEGSSKEENTAGNTESGEEKKEDSGNVEDASGETKADNAEDTEHKAENKDNTETDTKTENGNKTENENKTESDSKTEDNADTEKGSSESNKDSSEPNKDSSSSDKVSSDKTDSSEKGDSTDKSESSDTGKTSDSGNHAGDSSSNTESGKDSSGSAGNTSSGTESKGSSSGKTDSSDKSSSSEKQESSDKGSSDKGGSSEGNSSSENKSDSGSSDSGHSDSAGETAYNSLGISLNQILRVAEPEGLAETEEALPETEPETETEDTAAEETEIEAEETETETEETETETEETESKTEELSEETVPEMEETETEEDKTEEEGNAAEETSEVSEEVPEITGESGEDANSNDDEDDEAFTEIEDGKEAESVAVKEEEKDPFEEKGILEGKVYNLVAFESGLTARAFVTTLEKLGMNKEDLIEGGHILTYSISPVGSAVIVNGPELVRDEAKVSFGVIPQTGYKIAGVMANGVNLEEVSGENVASSSDARLASASEAGEGAVYYVIPSVLEDQEVEIILAEEIEGSHPAFRQAQTINGVTVTVSAEEGILPEGTYLEVREVTAEFEGAVKEKLEKEADENAPRTVSTVLAYDINLMLDGKKLSNHYWEGNTVNVTFSGKQIEETSKEADKIEILTMETPVEAIDAANGEIEEISASENISTKDVEEKIEKTSTIETIGEEGLKEVTFDAEHFSVYVYVTTTGQTQSGNNTDPDKPFIRVKKDFDGFTDSKIFDQYKQKLIDNGFSIGISDTAGKEFAKVDLANETYEEITVNGETYYRFTWKITDLEAGEYRVNESGADIDGFKRTTIMNGEIGDICDIETKKATMTFIGRQELPSNIESQDVSEIPMYVIQGKTHFVVWTVTPLSANEREYFFNYINGDGSWGNLGQGNNKLNATNTLFYHAGSTANGVIHYGGLTVTYKAPNVTFNASKEWTKALGLKYTTTSAQGAEIEVTNTYTPLPTEFNLVKKVEGSSVPNGAAVSFKMYRYDGEDVPGTPADTNGDGIPDGYSVYNPVIETSDFSNAGTEGFLSSAPQVIEGLVEGYYLIEEVEPLAGYQKLDGYIQIRVSVSETDGTLICNVLNEPPSGSRPSWKWSSDSGDGTKRGTLTVYNYTAPRLPDTGGPGVGLIKEFGWVLLLLALMMAGMEVQYYGERRKKVRVDEMRADEQRYEEP